MAWRVERVGDTDAGARRCLVVSLGGTVKAALSRTGEPGGTAWTVTVGFGNQPESLRYLRINDAIFQTAEPAFRGADAEVIVARLKRPGEFAFEWFRAPDSAKQPGLFGTGNFAAKAADCEAWIAGTAI